MHERPRDSSRKSSAMLRSRASVCIVHTLGGFAVTARTRSLERSRGGEAGGQRRNADGQRFPPGKSLDVRDEPIAVDVAQIVRKLIDAVGAAACEGGTTEIRLARAQPARNPAQPLGRR